MTLKGGEDGTVFKTLTVEGEDRVHVDFDRPELELNVDPQQAPGLDLGSAADVLDRTTPDYVSPLMSAAANEPSPYLAHPWLGAFAAGSVARFRPAVEHLERWKLVVANSRGEVVANYAGNGDPPAELAWDGRTLNGGQAAPGLTYSYVFEAYDRAGNKRNFVGQGFKVPAYRIDAPSGPVLVFQGSELAGRLARGAMTRPQGPAPILLEAAGYLNAAGKSKQPLRVTATARSFDEANAMATMVARDLGALTLGDPARIRPVATVEADAPDGGTVKISSEP
jgi:hypothetical protein